MDATWQSYNRMQGQGRGCPWRGQPRRPLKSDMSKISIRSFNDREVRAVWNDETNAWFFSVLDVVGVLNGQDDYAKNRNYRKWLKVKLKRGGNQLVSATTQLMLTAADGKQYRNPRLDIKMQEANVKI